MPATDCSTLPTAALRTACLVDGQTRLMASVSSFSTLKGPFEAVNDFSTRFVSITYVLLLTDPYEDFTGLDPCLIATIIA
jgi:hypothetical protein